MLEINILGKDKGSINFRNIKKKLKFFKISEFLELVPPRFKFNCVLVFWIHLQYPDFNLGAKITGTPAIYQIKSYQRFWQNSKSMTIECDDNDYESGSSCAFSCPAPYRVNGTDSITCNAGKWDAIAPSCCMGMWIYES